MDLPIFIFIFALVTMFSMAKLSDAPRGKHKIDGKDWILKDPSNYYIESLDLPEDQKLPGYIEKYFEFMEVIVASDMGGGKTYLIKKNIAPISKEIWRGNIAFFDAQDISGTIEAVLKSLAFVKFIFIDDAIREGLDSRMFNNKKNITGTQKFFIIRHLAKKGLLGAGYIILIFATQDLMAIDKRIRNHCAMLILKSYVDGCEKFIQKSKNPKDLYDKLYYLSDNARRRHRNDIRQIGYAIDLRGICHQVISYKIEPYEPIEWITVEDGTTLRTQMEDLIDFTLNKIIEYQWEEPKLTMTDLQGFMYQHLDIMKKKYYFLEVNDAYFTEVIKRARAIYREMLKNGEIGKRKPKEKEEIDTAMGGWDEFRILIMHDTLKMSFDDIERNFGIPHSTAHRKYHELKELHQNVLLAIQNQELEVEIK